MAQVYEDGSGGGAPWSFREAVTKGVAGTIGIMTALIVDYIQKGNDSAVLFATRLINQAASTRFHMDAVPPYVYLAVLVVAGFALVYIFEPTNKRNAFYAGAGVLGFLATFAPVVQQTLEIPQTGDLPTLESVLSATENPGTPTESAPVPAPGDDGHTWNNDLGLPVVPAVYRPLPATSPVIRAQTSSIAVDIVIQFPSGQDARIPQVSAWVHDNISNRTLALGAGAKLARTSVGPVIVYRTSFATTPRGNTLADLALRVEAEGYAITTVTQSVSTGTPLPVRLTAVLTPSTAPLWQQKLQYPYKW